MIGQLFAAIESLVFLADQIVFGYAHSTKVADLAAGAATALGWSSDRVNRLRLASLLHDIGHLVASPVGCHQVRAGLADLE